MSEQKYLTKAATTMFVVGGVLGAISVTTLSVFADGDPTTDTVPRLIPYQGMLELDGNPLNANGPNAIWLGFALYDGSDASEPVFTQNSLVDVYAGRFTVSIGNEDPNDPDLAEVLQAADDLYLGITLLGDIDDEEDDISMRNRQRILATPYAMWTTSATNLAVAANLNVGNDATIGRNLNVGNDLSVERNLEVGAGGRLRLRNTSDVTPNQDGALVIGDADDNVTLDANELMARSGGNVSEFYIASPLTVTGRIRGRLALRTVSAVIPEGVTTIDCAPNEQAISCGTDKGGGSGGQEDSFDCYVDVENNNCRTRRDNHGDPDGVGRGFCTCLEVMDP